MEELMRCIPTCAVMNAIDREWVAARRQLAAFLEETGPTPDDDARVEAPDSALTYLCSIPCRQSDGVIRYIHLFQQTGRCVTKPAYFHVAASAGWWPEDYRSLPPQRRTSGRAPLSLVS
jgi:hypothetical protein